MASKPIYGKLEQRVEDGIVGYFDVFGFEIGQRQPEAGMPK
jgi:hypothetical protein